MDMPKTRYVALAAIAIAAVVSAGIVVSRIPVLMWSAEQRSDSEEILYDYGGTYFNLVGGRVSHVSFDDADGLVGFELEGRLCRVDTSLPKTLESMGIRSESVPAIGEKAVGYHDDLHRVSCIVNDGEIESIVLRAVSIFEWDNPGKGRIVLSETEKSEVLRIFGQPVSISYRTDTEH